MPLSVPKVNWPNPALLPKQHDDWEKSTEEFLRKLNKPGRPSGAQSINQSGALPVRGYSPGVVSDLSSLSSDESVAGDIGGDSNKPSTLPQKRGNVKQGSSQSAQSKPSSDKNVTKTSKHRMSADRHATESSSRVKKVWKLLLLV